MEDTQLIDVEILNFTDYSAYGPGMWISDSKEEEFPLFILCLKKNFIGVIIESYGERINKTTGQLVKFVLFIVKKDRNDKNNLITFFNELPYDYVMIQY